MKDKNRILSITSILLNLLFVISFFFTFLPVIDYFIRTRFAAICFGIKSIFEGVTNYHLGKPVKPSKNNKRLRFLDIALGVIVILVTSIQLLSL